MRKLLNPKKILPLISSSNNVYILLLILIAFLSVLFTCTPIANYDIWWHLKTGEIITETSSIPTTDIFSFTKYGERWVSHEWLSEFVLSFLNKKSGVNGLIIFKILLIGFILFLLFKISMLGTNKKYLCLSLVPLFLVLSRHRFFVRPHLFTMIFFAVTYLFLELDYRKKISKKFMVVFFALMFLLWANFHGGFLYGLVLIYLYFISAVYEYIRSKKSNLFFLFILAVSCTLICLINPNGIDVFLYPLTIIKAGYVAANREWLSPFDKEMSGYYMTKYLIAYSSMLLIISLINFKTLSLKNILLLIFFFGLAVKSQRNIPFFAFISVPLFTKNISVLYDKKSKKIKIPMIYLKYLIIIIFLILTLFFYHKGIPIADKGRGFARCGTGVNKSVLPVDAMEFIINNNIKGNFFNSYQFGGYLLYHGYPKIKVFIDGRADVYGEQLYRDYRKSLIFPQEFQKFTAKYNFDYIFLEYDPDDKPLHDFLIKSKDWVLVYFDNTSLIYVKNIDNNSNLISKYGYFYVNPISKDQIQYEKTNEDHIINEYYKALAVNPDIEYAYIRLANFYRRKGDLLTSLKISKKGFKKFPNHYTILNQMGICYRHLKNFRAAEACFKKAVKENPYILDAYGNLAILYYEQNDLPKTRKFIEKTLKINPDDKIANTILKEIKDNR